MYDAGRMPPGALEFGGDFMEGNRRVGVQPYVNLDNNTKEVFAVPFWCVRRTPDMAGGNMDMGFHEEIVKSWRVSIPIMINNSATIEKGGEIAIYTRGTRQQDDRPSKRARQG